MTNLDGLELIQYVNKRLDKLADYAFSQGKVYPVEEGIKRTTKNGEITIENISITLHSLTLEKPTGSSFQGKGPKVTFYILQPTGKRFDYLEHQISAAPEANLDDGPSGFILSDDMQKKTVGKLKIEFEEVTSDGDIFIYHSRKNPYPSE